MKFFEKFSRRKLLKQAAILVPSTLFVSQALGNTQISLNNILTKSGFKNKITATLYDLETNKIIDSYNEELQLPLASVAKAVTAVYGMEAIGQNYTFGTELFTDGLIKKDILEGNIYLVGGADPSLTTDDLNLFVKALKSRGIRSISGDFFYDDFALPQFLYIDPSQLPEESFNPGFSGLNLNNNKVLFSWRKDRGTHKLSLEARGPNSKAFVESITIVGKAQARVVFEYILEKTERIERWYVSRKVLGKSGVRWLPVRLSSTYTCTALKYLLLQNGIKVGAPKRLKKQKII